MRAITKSINQRLAGTRSRQLLFDRFVKNISEMPDGKLAQDRVTGITGAKHEPDFPRGEGSAAGPGATNACAAKADYKQESHAIQESK
jgi:hypothetical protein